jgi:hypothetical protein
MKAKIKEAKKIVKRNQNAHEDGPFQNLRNLQTALGDRAFSVGNILHTEFPTTNDNSLGRALRNIVLLRHNVTDHGIVEIIVTFPSARGVMQKASQLFAGWGECRLSLTIRRDFGSQMNHNSVWLGSATLTKSFIQLR